MKVVGFVWSWIAFAYCKVMSLPWELIFNTTLRFGCLFMYTWIFWVLTEDLAVLGFPLATYVAPIAIAKFSDKLSPNLVHLLKDACYVSVAGLQYYLFKTNITQY
jgi:hypothetical protein